MKTTINFYYLDVNNHNNGLTFVKELDIPFTPFYGLTLLFKSESEEYEGPFDLELIQSSGGVNCSLMYMPETMEFFVEIIETTEFETPEDRLGEIKFFEAYGFKLVAEE